MAAGVATKGLNPTDTRARLYAAQRAEKQKRAKSGVMSSMPGMKYMRTAALGMSMLGATPEFVDSTETNDQSPQTQSYQATTAGEDYQQAFRSRQLNYQIGKSVGLDLDRRSSSQDEADELEQIQQDYAAREVELLQNNQRGLDRRSLAAKRSAQQALKKSGFEEGMKAVTDKLEKKLSALTVNLAGDAVEGIDVAGEDFYTSQAIVFVQRNIQAARTVLPLGKKTGEPESLQDLAMMGTEKIMDKFFPRFGFDAVGLAGAGGWLFQWFVIGLAMLVIGFIVLLVIALIGILYEFGSNPLSAVFGLARYQLGF